MPPLTGWQRLIARLLPWFDPKEQDARLERSASLTLEIRATTRTGRERVRQAYRAYGDRVER